MNEKFRARRMLSAALAAISFLSVTALAAPADDSSSALRVEAGGQTTSSIQAVADSDSPVKVTSDQAAGSFQVIYQDQEGKESTATVSAVDSAAERYAQVNAGGDSLRVRQGPGTEYPIMTRVYDGNTFPITGEVGGWFQIVCNGRTGYVSSAYIIEKNPKQIADPTVSLRDAYDDSLASQIVQYALQFKGYPYIYATAGPNSFDCSGFTSYVYAHFGYKLNRSSRDQLKNGVAVSRSQLQPGDIMLFSRDGSVVTHVGLYIGDGQMIHASTATTGVIISDINSKYYVNHYYASRRII